MIELYPMLKSRANTTLLWHSSDMPNTYKEQHVYKPNPYKPGDFTYSFNSHGFRCDELTLPSDINIVFLGCSVTEGVGLPMEHTWAYHLLTKIRQKTNKNIALWNLAIHGTGVDTQANMLYWFNKNFKIDYVFSLMPAMHRREYCLKKYQLSHWNPTEETYEGRIFADENYKIYQNIRSLMVIDSIIKDKKMYCTCWENSESTEVLKMKTFKSLNYFFYDKMFFDFARDGMHAGPTYHKGLAEGFWEQVEHLF